MSSWAGARAAGLAATEKLERAAEKRRAKQAARAKNKEAGRAAASERSWAAQQKTREAVTGPAGKE